MIARVSEGSTESVARRGFFDRLRRPALPEDAGGPAAPDVEHPDGDEPVIPDGSTAEAAPDPPTDEQVPEHAGEEVPAAEPEPEPERAPASASAADTSEGAAAPPDPAIDEDLPATAPAAEADDANGPLPGTDALEEAQRRDARTVPDEGDSHRFARPLPRVMAVANQKGGVGKTTTTVNLSASLADLGFRVLIVDLDPQGNASTGVGINIRDLETSMYDVLLHDAPMEDCIEATSVRNLYVAPANLDLAGAEIELVPAFSRELRLRNAIDSIRDDYDYVLIDCPPSLGLLTVNSLAAASEVLVPIQCEYYALEGLGQLLRNVGLVQKNLNPSLEVSVILCVMYDARTKLADQVVAEVRAHFGEKVCRTVVPRTVRLSEAPSYGQPISAFDPSSRGALAYREVAKEVSGGTP
jgi:chromosome partitioning protein